MTYQDYNFTNKKPKPAKNFGAAGASSDNYQRFLEYLENSGQTQAIRKEILENKADKRDIN